MASNAENGSIWWRHHVPSTMPSYACIEFNATHLIRQMSNVTYHTDLNIYGNTTLCYITGNFALQWGYAIMPKTIDILVVFWTHCASSITKKIAHLHITVSLWGEPNFHRWIPLIKGQWCSNRFHDIASSCTIIHSYPTRHTETGVKLTIYNFRHVCIRQRWGLLSQCLLFRYFSNPLFVDITSRS